MLYLKYMPFRSAINASRNKRELSAALEEHYETMIFSNDKPGIDIHLNSKIRRNYDGTVPVSANMMKLQKIPIIIKNYLSVIIKTIKLPYGVWSCHDLKFLKMAWFASLFRFHRPILVYDSHEFELGRNTKRTQCQYRAIKRWERFLMNRCAFSIVVNDTIADEVQRIHGLKERPIVVRSTPNYWNIDTEICQKTRLALLKKFSTQQF